MAMYVPIQEAAERLGLHPRRLRDKCYAGVIPSRMIGKRRCVPEHFFEAQAEKLHPQPDAVEDFEAAELLRLSRRQLTLEPAHA